MKISRALSVIPAAVGNSVLASCWSFEPPCADFVDLAQPGPREDQRTSRAKIVADRMYICMPKSDDGADIARD